MTENVQPPATVFDSKAFSDRLSGDNALMREIINIFLDETPKRMRELEKTVKKQQQETASRQAHIIKGSAANVSGNKLHAVALQVETACNSADWREIQKNTSLRWRGMSIAADNPEL